MRPGVCDVSDNNSSEFKRGILLYLLPICHDHETNLESDMSGHNNKYILVARNKQRKYLSR